MNDSPAKDPMKTKRRMKAVMSEPLFAGESNPSNAKVNVAKHMQKSCTPVPKNTLTNVDQPLSQASQEMTYLKSMGYVVGGRKTSPCTSFQPLSSFASSRALGSLY